jgi:diacylglycerol kinase (ATP)
MAESPLPVIWNPNAGLKSGLAPGGATKDELCDLLARHGLSADVTRTESEEDGVRQARKAVKDGAPIVVAAGGDGTVNVIARELLGSSTALGILPLGRVMNVARMVGVPRELEEAAAIVAAGHVRTIDVGDANGEYFYEGASVGISAAVFGEAARINDGDYGALMKALRLVIRFPAATMRISLDEETVTTRALVVHVANGPYAGLGFTVAPDASLDDGLLDVRVFAGLSRWQFVRHFAGIVGGRYRHEPKVSTYRSRSVAVEGNRPLPWRADGNDMRSTPVRFTLHPRALRIVTPRPDGA